MVEKETGKTIKTLRTDRGGEYLSREFNSYCESNGIKRQLTQARTLQQNGVSERRNQTLVEKARSMVASSGVPAFLWTEVINYTNHLVNRGPTRANHGVTPEQQYYKKCPDVSHLRAFGYVAYSHIPKENRKKLESKTRRCLMVGFDDISKSYRLYDPVSKKIILNRDVKFDESLIGFRHLKQPESPPEIVFPASLSESTSRSHQHTSENETDQTSLTHGESGVDTTPPSPSVESELEGDSSSPPNTSIRSQPIQTQSENLNCPNLQQSTSLHSEPMQPGRRISRRERHPSTRLRDHYLFFTEETVESKDYKTAIQIPEWASAIKQEVESINKNETWTYVKLPPRKRPITSKWIFKEKMGPSGKVEKLKA
jgi:hypothetical protein